MTSNFSASLSLAWLVACIICCNGIVNWTDCGLANKTISFSSITMSPDPAVRGENLTVYKKAYVTKEYSDSSPMTWSITNFVFIDGEKVPFIHFDLPMCPDFIQCPFGPGNITIAEGQGGPIPKIAKPGLYYAQDWYYGPDGGLVGCAEFYYQTV